MADGDAALHPPRRPLILRTVGVVLLVLAVVLGWAAFTRFGGEEPPQSGSPDFRDYHAAQVRTAQTSAVLGVAAAFALLGAMACLQRAAGGAPGASADDGGPPLPPGPPRP